MFDTFRDRFPNFGNQEFDYEGIWKSSLGKSLLQRATSFYTTESVFLEYAVKSWIEHLVASRQVDTKPSGSIKVAVIDEGIDPRQEDLTGKIMAGVSFCQHPKFPSRISAYFVPAGRHGTMIARLICRLWPNVKLYIARIQESNGKRLITGQSATQVCAYKVLLFLN
jgi:hypothetical protein